MPTVWLSTAPPPAKKSLRDHQGLVIQASAFMVAGLLTLLTVSFLPAIVVVPVAIGALLLGLSKVWQVKEAMLPDPLGTSPYNATETPRPKAEEQVYVVEDIPVADTQEIPPVNDDDDGANDVVFRNHWIDFFRESKRLWYFVVPVLVFAIAPVILAEIDDQRAVATALTTAAVISGLVVAAGAFKPSHVVAKILLWPFLWVLKKTQRMMLAVTIASVACLVALQVPSAMTAMVSGLVLVASFPILRRWAVWNSRRYIVTMTQYKIKTKGMWIFWITNGEKAIDLAIVRQTSNDTPPYVIALHAEETAGWVTVETLLQEDDFVSKNPNLIKDYKELENIINERRKPLQVGMQS